MAPTPVISCSEVVKRFDGRTVLDGVTLDVFAGETVVIMGGSGCGKSTFLRLLIGSLQPDGGYIKLFGHDIAHMEQRAFNDVRKRFGILFQSGALFNSMTLAENVALPIREHTDLSEEIIDIQVKIKLELVGLREHAGKLPSQISGGMKKRAGLARALALDPELLFYDEPSAGLDPVTSAEIDQLIIAMSRQLGVASVVVTHEMDSAFSIADRMVMLDKGRVLHSGERQWFDDLRKMSEGDAGKLPKDQQLIRQFLRGDAEGPLSERRSLSSFEADLLGPSVAITHTPSVEPTRR